MGYSSVLRTAIIGMFLLAGLGVCLGAIAAEKKAKPGEAIVTFDDPAHAEEGPVQFSHPAHKEAFGKEKLDCKQCHIKPKLFPMKRKAGVARTVITMEEMAAGKACGACHNGKTTVNDKVIFNLADEENCGRCHKNK